mmetsp:Transcript_15281/g.17003  ORF Transcript_15281/g.17003 Transcript_15281/m.17003 type:complete len:179 (-) Transcript_15281:106-642(-)
MNELSQRFDEFFRPLMADWRRLGLPLSGECDDLEMPQGTLQQIRGQETTGVSGIASKVPWVTPFSMGAQAASISVDVVETDSEFIALASLPGVHKNDLQIHVEGDNKIKIKGERNAEYDLDTYIRKERAFGTFHREFEVPTRGDLSGLKAQFENGVLRLTFPKLITQPKPTERTIPIV